METQTIETSTKRRAASSLKDSRPAKGSFHALLAQASQIADEHWRKSAKKHGLTSRQFVVLAAIDRVREDATRMQTDLVTATGVDRSTLADIVRRLVGKGLVARHRTKRDARAYDVKLTQSGTAILRAGDQAAIASEAELLAPLTEREAVELRRLLQCVVKR